LGTEPGATSTRFGVLGLGLAAGDAIEADDADGRSDPIGGSAMAGGAELGDAADCPPAGASGKADISI